MQLATRNLSFHHLLNDSLLPQLFTPAFNKDYLTQAPKMECLFQSDTWFQRGKIVLCEHLMLAFKATISYLMIRTRASAHQEERYATFLENFQHILNGWSQGLSCLLLIIILINFFNPFRSRNYHSFFCLYLKTSALSVLSCWWTPKMIRLFGYLVFYLKTFVLC